MARLSLWTPLLLILAAQLVLLFYLNLKTSSPGKEELVAVYISASDEIKLTARSGKQTHGKPRGAAPVKAQNVDQIEAPLHPQHRVDEKGIGEKREIDHRGVRVQIVADGEKLPVSEAVVAPAPVVEKEKKEKRVSVERGEKKRREGNGLLRREGEARERADIAVRVGERQKRNSNGDSVRPGIVRGRSQVKVEEEKRDRMREAGVVEKVDPVDVNIKRDEKVIDGRRKVNQVSMLKSHDQAQINQVGGMLRSHDQDQEAEAARRQREQLKKAQELERRAYELWKEDRLLHNDVLRDIGKKVGENPAIRNKAAASKDGANSTSTKQKRTLIEKVGQLKASKAGFGRLKDMPFMKARRFNREQNELGGKLPRPSMKRWDDISKYADKLNYFEEFCKEVSEPLVECGERTARELTESEKAGLNIMFTIRTTFDYHDKRLPVLFETWLSVVNPRTVFLVTDGEDAELDDVTENIGMHYINAQSGTTHSRTDLCCKAGVELELMFYQHNEAFDWICHIDDDIYVNLDQLVKTLAKFDPKNEPVYFGRSGSPYETPRLVKNESKLGILNAPYHFAVGGMYCLSRKMLGLVKDYLIGCEAFSRSCQESQEPEDVTVGLVIGAVLEQKLSRTEMIYTHGIDLLSFVPSPYLDQQIAFSYGYGSVGSWHHTPNVVYTPGAVFSLDEDITQFKSIHCSLYPNLQWCIDKKKHMATMLEAVRERPKAGEKRSCVCTWKTLMCCETWKAGYMKAAEETMKERLKEKAELDVKKKANGAKRDIIAE